MSGSPPRCRRPAPQRGFTLPELMIAVVILGVLMVIALPQFQQSIRKGRRSDAITALSAIQQAQERSRSSFSAYCDEIASAPTATRCGLGLGTNSSQAGNYALSIIGTPTGTSYVATAAASGAQTNDTACATLAVRMDRGTVTYGSSSSTTVDWTDSNRCWAK